MLVLSRRPGDSIVIDDRIVVTVLEIKGDTLKLGIDAPTDISIWRSEVLEDIKAQNRLAAEVEKEGNRDVLRIGELLLNKKRENE